jgi:hypothetical protein|tara:strand:- start:995 stop:1366 length:372 start_codon:yes stop_codon:yes gene_type:complete
MSKVFFGMFLMMTLAFGTYYYFTEKKITRLTENNAALSIVAQTNQDTIDTLSDDRERFQSLSNELNVKLQASEAYGSELSKKLREHNLTALTLRKPGLIETRVNNAVQKLTTELESITSTDSQ